VNLVLTYHRIVPQSRDISGFFDTTKSEFTRQLQSAIMLWKNKRNGHQLFDSQAAMSPQAPHLVITFDDGTQDHYELAVPLLEENGLRGIFYVSTALINTQGYMTKAQCTELLCRGHAVESHGHRHVQFRSFTHEELAEDLSLSRRELESIGGGTLKSFAAIGGYIGKGLEASARSAGFNSVRTLKWGLNKEKGFMWDSININRSTGGKYFWAVTSPRGFMLKKLIFAMKERSKSSPLAKAYYTLQRTIVTRSRPQNAE
jgi:peptidoglycan/xylan/chitin deacetylase (PgdA/CDA1 family)